jgi:hypothetical protein
VYYNAPTTSYASDISYEVAPQPQYTTYVEATPISYAPAPHVTYAAPPPPPPAALYSAPIAISVPVQQQQLAPSSSFAFDAAPASSSSSIDSYGAPQAPVIGGF